MSLVWVRNAAGTIMKITYGIDVADPNDRYITVAEAALDGMAKAASPGAFLVDMLPIRTFPSGFRRLTITHVQIVKHVPAWVPGASFQRKAREWKKVVLEMRDAPFEVVKNALVRVTILMLLI